jgi:hypothetical protein
MDNEYAVYAAYCTDRFPGMDINLRETTARSVCGAPYFGSLGWYMWCPKTQQHQRVSLYTMREKWLWTPMECKEFVSMFDTRFYKPR